MSLKSQNLSRRRWLRKALMSSSGLAAAGASGWLTKLAAAEPTTDERPRQCILLWMSGGPSQIDTFDMKPNHPNGGQFKEIATSVPGIRFSEHLPRLAKQADRLAILRGVSTKEGDHERGSVVMRTGHIPGGPVDYPAIGCCLAKELVPKTLVLPQYVSIAPGVFITRALSPGFLGPSHAATSVAAAPPENSEAFARLQVDYLKRDPRLDVARYQRRIELWRSMQADFLSDRSAGNAIAHNTAHEGALRMMASDAGDAFDLSSEPDAVREQYGRGSFGQGCLMARRLIERGVPLVEVTLGDGLGWDTHADNFSQVKALSTQLDAGWSTLMTELADRGLLDTTTILWAGEFGRTPKLNAMGGRDHFPQAFSCVLAGGGISGGQAYGATSDDGTEVIEGRMDQQDLLATLCKAVGVNPATENIAAGGRPIAISEGRAVKEVLA